MLLSRFWERKGVRVGEYDIGQDGQVATCLRHALGFDNLLSDLRLGFRLDLLIEPFDQIEISAIRATVVPVEARFERTVLLSDVAQQQFSSVVNVELRILKLLH